MSTSSKATLACICAVCVLLIGSCGGGSSLITGSTSTLNLGLTDGSITGVTKVWIQFTGVEVKPANANPIDFTFSPSVGLDLLTLQGGKTATFLNGKTVPAGPYEWVRLMVDTTPGASYVVSSTGQHNLTIPSGAETGLKLIQGFMMPVGGVADFTVDFVLSKSLIAPTGLSPDYLLKPVLRLVDNAQVGTIAGTLGTAAISARNCNSTTRIPAVYVYAGASVTPDDIYNPPSGTTDTDAATTAEPLTTSAATLNSMSDWVYTIAFLPAGTYTVAFTCDPDDPAVDESATSAIVFSTPQPAIVTAGMTTTVNF